MAIATVAVRRQGDQRTFETCPNANEQGVCQCADTIMHHRHTFQADPPPTGQGILEAGKEPVMQPIPEADWLAQCALEARRLVDVVIRPRATTDEALPTQAMGL